VVTTFTRLNLNSKSLESDTVATIGNFDGIHLGHQQIINEIVSSARQQDGQKSLVIGFYPHPLEVINPSIKIPCITSVREKISILSELGVDSFVQFHFTKTFALLSAQYFIEELLLNKLRVKHLIVGEDTRVGHGREGDLELIKSICRDHDVKVTVASTIAHQKAKISSRDIRDRISKSDLSNVTKMLGRHYSITGRVIKGSGRGKKLGIPTANIVVGDKILPPDGVYITKVETPFGTYQSVTNIGTRPTFGVGGRIVETHIIGYCNEDIYDKYIKVMFIEKIRDEVKFTSSKDLVDQINRDIDVVKKRVCND